MATSPTAEIGSIPLDHLLSPVAADLPCGPCLEYDPEFLALERAVRDATQVPEETDVAGVHAAVWMDVKTESLFLLDRSKDLRLVIFLVQALVREQGFRGLQSGLTLLRGLLERYWPSLHPLLDEDDDGNPTHRLNVLHALIDPVAVVGPLRRVALARIVRGEPVTLDRLHTAPPSASREVARSNIDVDSAHESLAAIEKSIEQLSAISSFLCKVTGERGPATLNELESLLQDAAVEVSALLRQPEPAQSEPAAPAKPTSAAPGAMGLPERTAATQPTEDEELVGRYDQNVQFTVYRPRVMRPGDWYPLLAFAHLSERPEGAPPDGPDPLAEVERQARQILREEWKRYQALGQDTAQPVPREGDLTFVPQMPGVDFNPPSRSFRWQESVHREEFRMRAGPALDGQVVRGRMSVFLGSILVAELAMTVRVDRSAANDPARQLDEADRARPYRKIFASYARADRAIVEQFERYARILGDEYMRDLTHLRAGEVWSDRVAEMIESADVFQLFWSWGAIDSRFVRQEWHHALALDRSNFVRPVYWESPFPEHQARDLPPEALRRLHFQRLPLSKSRVAAERHRPTLVLQLESGPERAGVEPTKSFGEDGGCIGRNPDNTWCLSDSERYLSGRHAQIFWLDGDFYIKDHSTNGTFLNDDSAPVRGLQPLCEGDRITIGEYRILVGSAVGGPSGGDIPDGGLTSPSFAQPSPDLYPFEPLSRSPTGIDAPAAASARDPLDALEPHAQTAPLPIEPQSGIPTESPPAHRLPKPFIELIPEDWDQPDRIDAAVCADEAESSPRSQGSQPSAAATIHGSDALVRSFAAGAGLAEADLAGVDREVLLHLFGKLLRALVASVNDLMRANAATRAALRMSPTILPPTENNPLKLSMAVDEVMRLLLSTENAAHEYLPPERAIREVFDDVSAHQIAMVSAVRGVCRKLLERFDPLRLKSSGDSGLRGVVFGEMSDKAHGWDAFEAQYELALEQLDDWITELFARELLRAYRTHLGNRTPTSSGAE